VLKFPSNEIQVWIWRVLVLLLPVTSLPILVRLIGSDTVAAPSGVLLLFSVLLWLIPYVLKRSTFPSQSIPLLVFAFVALLSSALSIFYIIPPYKDVNPLTNQISALLTLAIGLSFFLVTVNWLSNPQKLSDTFRWVNLGGAIMLAWCIFQAIFWFANNRYPFWMGQVQDIFSVGPLYRQRVTGFALEPSWLAHQLNMLYLPFWLAASYQRFSVYKFRIVKLTIENLLLVCGLVMMFLTFSRVGLVAFVLMIGYFLLRMSVRLIQWGQGKLLSRFKTASPQRNRHRMITILLTAVLILIYLTGVFLGAYVLSRFDPRMKDLFTFKIEKQNTLLKFAERLTFAARIVYWQAGWDVYNDYPWFGVGLGNSGFFFPEKITSFGWKLIEVRQLIYHESSLPNPKSLWVRVLAETGTIGFACFIAWLVVLWNTSRLLEHHPFPSTKVAAYMGKFVMIGLLLEGFSIDSFALPYLWISLGILVAPCNYESNDLDDGINN